MNKKIVHDALILTAFTLTLGFVLGLVYGITKEPIAAADAATAQAAYQNVFAEADASLMEENGYADEITDVQVAKDSAGSPMGYVITVTAKDGSQANITFSVGITKEGTVNGYSITSIAETPGLGDKAKNEEFSSQFQGKQADVFNVVKSAPASESEIESISGATITSKAMTNGVNACVTYFRNVLEGGAE